jgi:biopolymer transport protein ExbD
MVDLGFLLITFFVFTTTMSQPTAMNMNEPKDDPNNQLKVKNSGAMTLLLGKNDQVYYYYGELSPTDASNQFKSTNFKDIRQLDTGQKESYPYWRFNVHIKSDKEATFKNAIDILDEMAINAVPPGHYAEVDMSDTESQLIKMTEQANGINNLWNLLYFESNKQSILKWRQIKY